jgi:hypothetical protein
MSQLKLGLVVVIAVIGLIALMPKVKHFKAISTTGPQTNINNSIVIVDSLNELVNQQSKKIDSLEKKRNEKIIVYKPLIRQPITDSIRQVNILRFFK